MTGVRGDAKSRRDQKGAALLLGLVLLALVGVSIVILTSVNSNAELQRDQRTQEALAQAKTALLGFASGVTFTFPDPPERPGELPCPDRNNDGIADPPCLSAPTRLGRLPWRTLGLPDLRDGDGERLWYAVSTNFKNNPRTVCNVPPPNVPGTPPHNFGCLNTETYGTITVRDRLGTVVHDGTEGIVEPTAADPGTTAAIAVLIAPGSVLTRELATAPQDRTPGSAASLDPVNYLDRGNGEDNSTFDDGTLDGFINGPIYDAQRRQLVNDRILILSYQDLIPVVVTRVLREVSACLDRYAALSFGLFPWAAGAAESGLNSDYADMVDNRFGRLPESFAASMASSGCGSTPPSNSCMSPSWPAAPQCNLTPTAAWWINWRSQLFYSVAEAYRPQDIATAPACGDCLRVWRGGTVVGSNVRYFVAVSGRRLGGQVRGDPAQRGIPTNYLEGENVSGDINDFQAGETGSNDIGIWK